MWPAIEAIGVDGQTQRLFDDEHAEQADHPALKELGRRFSRRSRPAKAGAYVAWLQDGGTADEAAALRAHVPGPVLALLAGVFGRGYRRDIAPVWRS